MDVVVRRISLVMLAVCAITAAVLVATPAGSAATVPISGRVTDVSHSTPSGDVLSQNETQIAINPANSKNVITSANDCNYNDGCAVNTTFDGGTTLTSTLPNGFVPGMTKFTNDPAVPGTGAYQAAGAPGVALSQDSKIVYLVCQAFNFTSPYQIALLLSCSHDGRRSW